MVSSSLFWLIFFVFSTRAEDGGYMDPSHLPVPNLNAAARGYNIFTGAPFTNNFANTGFRGRIFKTTKMDKQGRVTLQPGVESSGSLGCSVSMSGDVITSMKQYRDAQRNSFVLGNSWRVGLEAKVSANVDLHKHANVNVAVDIQPFIKSESSDEFKTENITSFFRKEKGAIVQLTAQCTKHVITFSPYHTPRFSKGFVEGLKRLYNAPPEKREDEFKTFVSVFGTHYSEETHMGSKMVYSRRYTRNEREFLNKNDIIKCAKKQSQFLFGTFEKNRTDCETKIGESKGIDSNYVFRDHLIGVGAKPYRNIEKWVEQSIVDPLPIQMKLRAINELFTEKNLEKLDINATRMIEWYDPMYRKLCSVMGYVSEAGTKEFCGIVDNCRYGERCVELDDGNGFVCRKDGVNIFWRQNPDNPERTSTKIRVLTLGGDLVMDTVSAGKCERGHLCNWTVETLAHDNERMYIIDPYDVDFESTYGYWFTHRNSKRVVRFLRVPHVDHYWLNVVDTNLQNVLVKRIEQCRPDASNYYEEDDEGSLIGIQPACTLVFDADENLDYTVLVSAWKDTGLGNELFTVQKVFSTSIPNREKLRKQMYAKL